MTYRRSGRSGIRLPLISLGLWHNFGHERPLTTQREICRRAFDLGVTHFDLANNYGPPYGSAEENFGRILATDLRPYRDELIISTKAGWDMWPGPYGDLGSRKYLLASLDQGLLTDRYLHGIPADSRAATSQYLHESDVTDDVLDKVRRLNDIAARRGQSLAQMALAWALRDPRMTSLVIGASSVRQLE